MVNVALREGMEGGVSHKAAFGILDLVDCRELAPTEDSLFSRNKGVLGDAAIQQLVR